MSEYNGVIFFALVGFAALAALLLVPVYRFLRREEKVAEAWMEASYPPADESPEDESTDGGGAPRKRECKTPVHICTLMFARKH